MKATTFAMPPSAVQKLLDGVIYEALLDMVDLDALHRLEGVLVTNLLDLGEIEPDKAIAVASMMIERAWHKLAEDPRRYADPRAGDGMDCELCAEAASHSS